MGKLFARAILAVLLAAALAGAWAEAPEPRLTVGESRRNLVLGKTLTLRPRLENTREDARFTYSSDNEAVASVTRSGLVSGHSLGEATITCAAATASGRYEASVSLRVIKPVASVNLGRALTVAAGTIYPLAAEIRPRDATDKSLTWSSSRESVATVDQNGVIAAHAEGSATITAITADGSRKRAMLKVTVREFQAEVRSRQGTLLSYPSGSGMFGVSYSTGKGRVSAVSGKENNTVLIKPLEPGADTVTVSLTDFLTGAVKDIKFEVYVTPSALAHETDAQASALEGAALEAGMAEVYELAYEIRHSNFSVFLLIDTNEKTVLRFASNDSTILLGRYKGSPDKEADVHFTGGKAHVYLRFAAKDDPAVLIMRDMDGVDWPWRQAEVKDAVRVLRQGNYTVITRY